MAKWKCEICGNEFDNFHAQGFDNKIYCPLCYFKKENQELKKQLEENKDKINWYENFEINKTIDKLRIKHNNQQKEFIEWLEAMSKMYENEYKDIDIAGHYNCVLAKYKETIGDDK